jgi:ribosomal subunit interface protein
MKVRFATEGFELTTELDKYAARKVAQMTRRIPRKPKADASCEVRFAHSERAGVKHNTCSITFTLGKEELKAEESTQHMYAALDIAAVRIQQQLETYAKRQKKHRLQSRLKRHTHTD